MRQATCSIREEVEHQQQLQWQRRCLHLGTQAAMPQQPMLLQEVAGRPSRRLEPVQARGRWGPGRARTCPTVMGTPSTSASIGTNAG